MSVTGGTLRSPGAMMAITGDNVAGYVSNGCIDADIITRARLGQFGAFIYGEGSPFRDIILPCGGHIEILLIQNLDRIAISTALLALDNRETGALALEGQKIEIRPRLRLRIAGRGAACLALADLAKASGFEVVLQSPDADLDPEVQHLIDPSTVLQIRDDAWTAVVLLFHDHDWEPMLLKQAVSGSAFYVGAMGSEKTHLSRQQMLSDLGVGAEQIDRIHAPIGLIPAQRDARSLALSILAEVVQTAQERDLL